MDISRQRKKRFADILACCCDSELAAELTGSSPTQAREEGIALLESRYVQNRLRKLMRQRRELSASARSGLERLAFSRCNDAVTLAFLPTEAINRSMIRKMDLSCIASIKRDKDGGVDIKLFDRERALEALMRLDESETLGSSAEDILSALSEPYGECEEEGGGTQ